MSSATPPGAGSPGRGEETIVPGVARLVLFDNPVSSNALKVRFLLAELGLDARAPRRSPLSRPRPGRYLALNPVGGIPALDDDGFVLAESHAILRYLARREARADLYPAAAGEQARVDEFLERFHTGIRAAFFRHETPALGLLARTRAASGAVPPDPERAAAVEAEIQPTLRLLDAPGRPERRGRSGASRSPTAPWRRCCSARRARGSTSPRTPACTRCASARRPPGLRAGRPGRLRGPAAAIEARHAADPHGRAAATSPSAAAHHRSGLGGDPHQEAAGRPAAA